MLEILGQSQVPSKVKIFMFEGVSNPNFADNFNTLVWLSLHDQTAQYKFVKKNCLTLRKILHKNAVNRLNLSSQVEHIFLFNSNELIGVY